MKLTLSIFLADPMILQFNIEKTIHRNGEAALAALDRKMISQLNDKTSKSVELKGLLSKGLYKLPAKNCISLMTTSGAKGGAVSIFLGTHVIIYLVCFMLNCCFLPIIFFVSTFTRKQEVGPKS